MLSVIQEVDELTTLTDVSELTTCGSVDALPKATPFTLPVADKNHFERIEGMRVELSSSNNDLSLFQGTTTTRDGFVDVSAGRLWTPHKLCNPAKKLANWQQNELNRIQMDDNSNKETPVHCLLKSYFQALTTVYGQEPK